MIEQIILYDACVFYATKTTNEPNYRITLVDKLDFSILPSGSIRIEIIAADQVEILYYRGRYLVRYEKQTVEDNDQPNV